jgi:hypothetical protein
MDERAARALERVKAARRATTAVEVRCARSGHLLLSFHPVGRRGFLVWRRPGRLTGPSRDEDRWQRYGSGTTPEGFGAAEEDARIVDGPEAHHVDGLLGRSRALACRCGGWTVDTTFAERVHEALLDWWLASRRGEPPNPRQVVLSRE